jgi:pimeloyl-ACP methyl ester carboxylesterase
MSGIAFKTLGGEGDDVVLIHGFGSDRLSWLGNAPALMALARVHALDLPGHGDSALDVGDGSPAALADRIEAALDQQGLGRMHVVGHSLGGGVALILAARKPERIASLALLAPAGLGTGVNRDFLEAYPQLDDADGVSAQLRRLVLRPMLINKMTVQRVLDQLGRAGARDALRRVADGLIEHETALADAAHLVATPRLVLWGDGDTINPPDPARVAGFGGQSVTIPEAGHLPHIEGVKIVNPALAAFLRQHVAKA